MGLVGLLSRHKYNAPNGDRKPRMVVSNGITNQGVECGASD